MIRTQVVKLQGIQKVTQRGVLPKNQAVTDPIVGLDRGKMKATRRIGIQIASLHLMMNTQKSILQDTERARIETVEDKSPQGTTRAVQNISP
jgi:hypothetical protein